MSISARVDRREDSAMSLKHEMHRLFGHGDFRGKQEAVVSQVMAGIDTIAIMPTGAGKSLCYQLPAMLLPGTTLIISPLIALMKDQFDSLPSEVYERTTIINSTLSVEELQDRVGEIIRGRYKLVYCAPERLRQQPFVRALSRANISLLVVDEAHCVSMWGHDFRPDYLFIGKCLPSLGRPTLLALTATSTPQMRQEIAGQLGRDLKPVVASVLRPNLYYEVEELGDKEEKMRRLLDICRREKGPGVIYARSRETCEQLAAMLRRAGVQAAHYHAGLPAEERTRTQEQFMLDRVRVIVATIAFGMGIDKSNVRFIVHFSPPDSLESYVQESGRAGRDGRDARCILLVTPGDKTNLTRWKRQEELSVEELRAIYREVTRNIPAGKAGFVSMAEAANGAGMALRKTLDESQVRVATSLLERVGLLLRHPDAPRVAVLGMTEKGERAKEPDFAGFQVVASLQPEQTQRRDVATLAAAMDVSPPELERMLLDWAERGLIFFRGDRRDPVIERLQPPQDTANAINRMLESRDRAQQRQIDQMFTYASAEKCRHQMLAAHLGEEIEECGTSCDVCAPPLDRPESEKQEAPDLPDNPGQIIVESLLSFPFRVGTPSLAKALTGSAASNITPNRVKHFGALGAVSQSAVGKAIEQLVQGGYLDYYMEDEFRLLEVTPEGREGVPRAAVSIAPKRQRKEKAGKGKDRDQKKAGVQMSRASEALHRQRETEAESEREATPEEADLFERLKHWRRFRARELGYAPYMIFLDKTLWAIARARPTSSEELLEVKGVGQSHIDKYGPDLLGVIAQIDEEE